MFGLCRYLENCRNDLAREVIRLRNENQELQELSQSCGSYSRSHNTRSPHLIESSCCSSGGDKSRSQSFPGNKVSNEKTKFHESASITSSPTNANIDPIREGKLALQGIELNSLQPNSDENWEEITARLVKELREMTKANRSSNSKNLPSGFKKARDDVKKSSDVGTEGTQSTQSTLYYVKQSNSGEYETQTKHLAISDIGYQTPLANDSVGDRLGINSPKIKSIIKVQGARTSCGGSRTMNESNQHSSSENYSNASDIVSNKSDNNGIVTVSVTKEDGDEFLLESNTTELVTKVVKNVALDIEKVTQALYAQNDRLRSLKPKQLRNFFQRQLDVKSDNRSMCEHS